MKKLLILLLTVACALCLAFAVAGCKPDGGESSGGTNTQQGETGGSEETGGGSEETDGEQEVNPPVTKKYTVTYDANGGKFAEGGSTITQSVEELSKLTAPLSPARSNYAFSGWAKNKSGSEMWKFEEDTVTGNITLYAQWTQESAVILSVEGASIEDKSIFMLVDKDTDSVSLSSKVVCSDDSIWRLYSDPDGQREIPTKMVTRLSNGNNTYYIVVNSQNQAQVNVYELTVHRSYLVTVSYYDDESLLDTAELYTGNTFTASYLPDITGYTFNGWKELNGTAFTSDVIYSPLVLYADKTANTYKATFDVNGGNTLSETEKTVTYDSEYSFPVPTRTGYSFTGWYADGTQLTNEKGKSLSIWQYAKAQNITAHWSANNYKVTIVNDTQAGTVYGDGEHAYDSQVTIDVDTNKGYNFIGWYDKDNQLVSDQERYTFKMGFAVSYTAKWEVDPAMENFVFTSTPTTCTISDVKDNSVQTIDIPDYVTSIGNGAFSGCTNLESLTLPFVGNGSNKTYFGCIFGVSDIFGYNYWVPESLKTVIITGGKNIGEDAFIGCDNLTNITIGNGVTSIGESAFHGCKSLESITIPFVGGSRKTADKTDQYPFGYIFGTESFSGASAIEQKYYGNSTSKTTITKYYIPNSLKQVTITGGNILYGAFYNCTNITSVTLPDSVTSIGEDAFYNCTSLESITVTENNTAYSSQDGILYNKDKTEFRLIPKAIKSVTLPDGITDIGNAFANCTSLESITVTDNNTAYSSQDGILYNKDKTEFRLIPKAIKSVTLPDGITNIDVYFADCTSLESITVTENNTAYSSQDGILYNKDKTEFVLIPKAIKGAITIPDSVTSIGEYAFNGCTSLESITIPDSVTSIGEYAFNNCGNLESINFDDKSQLASIGDYAFQYCSRLTSVTIPDNVTSIGSNAFNGCTAEIKWGDNPSIKEIDFFSGYLGTSITIPDSVTSIGGGAFWGCKSLTSITIPDSVTSIGVRAFYNCTSLTSVTIGNGVTSIGDYAFQYCSNLESVHITDIAAWCNIDFYFDNNVDNYFYANPLYYAHNLYLNNQLVTELTAEMLQGVTTIKEYAFAGCSKLTSITIPYSVTSIDYRAFYKCKLNSVKFENPDGWYRTRDSSATSGTSIPSKDLQTPETAATYLKETYTNYYWKRKTA